MRFDNLSSVLGRVSAQRDDLSAQLLELLVLVLQLDELRLADASEEAPIEDYDHRPRADQRPE